MAGAGISVGPQIRAWRQTSGLSQFELASRAGFSVRHVSFIETGRANPSREAVLALGEALGLSLRERNRMLEAAGFARIFHETPLSAHEMAHMRGMLQFIHSDDDERLWTGDVVIEKRSEQEGRRDGAQADGGERLKGDFSYWEFLGVFRSGQIFVSC